VFVLFEFKFLLTVLEENLFLYQVVAQTEKRSRFTSMIGVYYLLKLPKEISFFDESKKKIFCHRYK